MLLVLTVSITKLVVLLRYCSKFYLCVDVGCLAALANNSQVMDHISLACELNTGLVVLQNSVRLTAVESLVVHLTICHSIGSHTHVACEIISLFF